MTSPTSPQRGESLLGKVITDVPRLVRYDWLAKVAAVSGKALHLGIALVWLAATRPSEKTLLTRRAMASWNLSRDATYDGLRRLERAGLIRVWRLPGRSPHIILTEPGSDSPLRMN